MLPHQKYESDPGFRDLCARLNAALDEADRLHRELHERFPPGPLRRWRVMRGGKVIARHEDVGDPETGPPGGGPSL